MARPTKTALLLFARRPEAGKVKTRLAATVGDEAALRIYIRLLDHTRTVAKASGTDVFVFVTELDNDDFWSGFTVMEQHPGDLGAKMEVAFTEVFALGYQQAIIIGSDCPELSAGHVREAVDQLSTHDFVVGPAMDGGYYLLGMHRLFPALFRGKSWSTAAVLEQTLTDIERASCSVHMLPPLRDVDEVTDLPSGWLNGSMEK